MNINLPEIIQEAAEYLGAEYRSDYSGRAMYGDTCPSVVFDRESGHDAVKLGMTIAAIIASRAYFEDGDAEDAINEAIQDIGDASTDSMGLGTVTYWPRLRTRSEV